MKRTIRQRAPHLAATAVILVSMGLVVWHWYYARWQAEHFVPSFFTMGLPDKPFTVLFLGNDVSYTWDQRRQIGNHSSFDGRSDTMLVMRIDPTNKWITGVQIPRDTVAEIPGYGVQKINAANAIGGPELARQAASGLLGIPIDHYVLLNVQGLVDVVNELGGITVAVPKKMSYMDWTAKLKIDLQPGSHTLTGNQAMGFVRFRHDALGDIGRIQRQQIFIQAFAQKMLNPQSWTHIPRLVDIMHQSVQTDLSDVDMFRTFNLVRSVPKDRIKLTLLPGHFGGYGSWVVDRQYASQFMTQLSTNPQLTDTTEISIQKTVGHM
jgi:LCP family protein required for cell wall assembly